MPFDLVIGFWVFMLRQMQSGGNKALSFGKSRARLHSSQQKKVTFKDVAGVEEAKEELQEALFSREEMKDIPIDLHTQFFKSSDVSAKLSVLAHVDIARFHFRKADGRNNDTLTVLSGVFDRNGNMINAMQKTVEMRLKDQTLTTLLGRGLTVKTTYDVTPGTYVVRLVVRDSEGQTMAACNGAIEIP